MADILIVGVGGQGTLLASRVLGNLALSLGYDVKVSEVHGMAQRGGSVVTHVRFSDKVLSPIIDNGGADIILAFEKMEALRWLCYLKHGGKIFVNTQQISPMPVVSGSEEYPTNIEENIKAAVPDAVFLDALSLASEAGNEKAVNIVLTGAMARSTGIAKESFEEAIRETVPERFLDVNLRAFDMGYNS